MSFLSGSTGYVKLGATTYSFDKWRLAIKSGTPKVTNFTSGGYQVLVGGIISATISCSGPWNVTNTPIAVNTAYVFHLGLDTGVELVVTAYVNSLEPENSAEDAARVSITAESTGSFTASIT